MKVMIVDDEPSIIRMYRTLLVRAGHQVVGEAANGADAVALYRNLIDGRRPDVVLMDHRMPLKDGIAACREIIDLDPAAQVIIATADESIREQAFEAGAVRFKLKPFSPADLYSNLRSLDGSSASLAAPAQK